MTMTVNIWDLFMVFMTIGTALFAATWTLLHRMVFNPLDKIAKELTSVKDVFGPRIASLEAHVEHLKRDADE